MKDIRNNFRLKDTEDKFELISVSEVTTNQVDKFYYFRSDRDNIIVFADYDIPVSAYYVDYPEYTTENPVDFFVNYISDFDDESIIDRLNKDNNLVIYVEHRLAQKPEYLIIKDNYLYELLNDVHKVAVAPVVVDYALKSLEDMKQAN